MFFIGYQSPLRMHKPRHGGEQRMVAGDRLLPAYARHFQVREF